MYNGEIIEMGITNNVINIPKDYFHKIKFKSYS